LNMMGEAVAMQRPKEEAPQNEHVKRALEKINLTSVPSGSPP
jgi:hypothetical protein